MERVYIKATQDTPEVNFDFMKNYYSIKGTSVPENAHAFYVSLFEKLNSYYSLPATGENNTIDIKLDYFNTASGKMLLLFFETVAKINKRNRTSSAINWSLASEDEEDIIDFIETIEEISGMKINLHYIN